MEIPTPRRRRWFEESWHDVQYAVRSLRAAPAVTTVVLLTLALGVGVNTGIFSVLDDTVMRRLPIPEPHRLAQLMWTEKEARGSTFNWPEYRPLLAAEPPLPNLFVYRAVQANLRLGAHTEYVRAHLVSGSYYQTLGIGPALGRMIAPGDDTPAAAPVAVVSHAYWRRRFSADPAIIGTSVYLDGVPVTIVGVAPQRFHGLNPLSPPDITCPLSAIQLSRGGSRSVRIFTRLEPGASLAQAQSRIAGRFRDLLEGDLRRHRSWMKGVRLELVPSGTGEDAVRGAIGTPVRLLAIAGALLLLICCTNTASLLLTHVDARAREIAVRLSLGAGRPRIIRQLLVRSLLLALGGGCLGALLGYWTHQSLVPLLGIETSDAVAYGFEMSILAFTLGVSVVAGLLVGAPAAFYGAALDIGAALKARAGASSGRRLAARRLLLVVQVCVSVALLVGAGLLVGTLRNLQHVDVGFAREDHLVMTVDPKGSGMDGERAPRLIYELMDRMDAVGDGTSAAVALVELFGSAAHKSFWLDGDARGIQAGYNVVSPGFFATTGIPIVSGRDFSPNDRTGSPAVVIVNEAFVNKYFGSQNSIGRRLGDHGLASTADAEIIGVVKNSRFTNVRLAPEPTVFQPLYQFTQEYARSPGALVLHVRAQENVTALIPAIEREVRSIDYALAVRRVGTVADRVATSFRQERLLAFASALFGTLALVLCCIGLYGLAADAVARRAHDTAVRIALGATRVNVLWMSMRETLILVGIGVAVGVPVAVILARLLKSSLFGVTPLDPRSYVSVVVILLGVGLFASFIPARRASKIEPIRVLRAE